MKKIRHHFNHLPEIKEYLAREDSFKGPFLPPGYTTLVIEAKSDTCEEHHDNAHEKKEHHHHCAVLGYWGIRGLGQIPRLLLSHFKVEFKDKKYLSKEEWFDQDKTALGLTFANLPYYIDHDVRLTESSAINKYLIEKYDKTLLGKDVKDSAIVDEILGVLKDGVTDIVSLFFNPEHEKAKTAVLEKSKTKFEYLQKFIGEKNHALGYLTLTDFVIAENAYYVEKIFPEEYKTWPFFNNIRKAVN